MLDLCAGLGGASRAMRERGWTVTTLDLDPRFGTDVVADLTTWHWDGGTVDLLWASPPCDEFAREDMPWCRTGQAPSLTLVQHVQRLVAEIRPRYWVLENVRGAQPYLGRAPAHYGPIYLWGWFPQFDCTVRPWKERLSSARADLRAEIPYELSLALAQAVERKVLPTDRKKSGQLSLSLTPHIVYAADCQSCLCCGEPYCVEHDEHYADCDCIGPDSDEALAWETA